MNNYYFTFGQSHVSSSGKVLKDCWIRVIATDYETARNLFIQSYTSIYMDKPDMFAFQYDDSNFNRIYFPEGEYILLEQDGKK